MNCSPTKTLALFMTIVLLPVQSLGLTYNLQQVSSQVFNADQKMIIASKKLGEIIRKFSEQKSIIIHDADTYCAIASSTISCMTLKLTIKISILSGSK